ncbi:hypothetical protein V8C44DRAFT_330057 [Trichoderma aethiopicum]
MCWGRVQRMLAFLFMLSEVSSGERVLAVMAKRPLPAFSLTSAYQVDTGTRVKICPYACLQEACKRMHLGEGW